MSSNHYFKFQERVKLGRAFPGNASDLWPGARFARVFIPFLDRYNPDVEPGYFESELNASGLIGEVEPGRYVIQFSGSFCYVWTFEFLLTEVTENIHPSRIFE